MPVFRDFSENGELLQERFETLNAENFERYVKVNGIEIAKGYLDALEDFMKLLDHCSDKPREEGNGKITLLPRSEADLRRQLLKLQNQTVDISNLLKQTIGK